jgi:hypothetical protein
LLDVLKHDDVTVMSEINQDGKVGSGDRQNYALRIVERKHHHVVYETGDHADVKEMQIAVEVEKKLRQKFTNVDFILDRDARNTVHKFYRKGDEQTGDEFPIHDTVSDRYLGLSEESRIFETIPRGFHVIRIYADVLKPDLPNYRKAATEIAQAEKEVI